MPTPEIISIILFVFFFGWYSLSIMATKEKKIICMQLMLVIAGGAGHSRNKCPCKHLFGEYPMAL
jgi:hypothetical protein